MKKILLSAIIAGSTVYAFAQTPTMDFESWNTAGTEPTGWISENEAIIQFPPYNTNPVSVFKATSPADVHGGSFAMQILSVKMKANPASGKLPDPIGLAATGQVNLLPPSLQFGFSNTSRPVSVSFWYKYAPVSGDVAAFFIALTKWNTSTNKRDTIANGFWTTNAAMSAYTMQSVQLNYYSVTASPDSMALIFSSTKLFNPDYTLCMNCGKEGSTLWVDDITFSGQNGINEILTSNGVTLFPNPGKEFVTVSVDALKDAFSVNTYDMTGRIICSTPLALSGSNMNTRSGIINTSDLSSGLYSYSVMDKNGVALRAGKFNVVK